VRFATTPSSRLGRGGLFVFALVAAAVVGAAACRKDDRATLTIYSPHGRDLLTLVETTFESANPSVDVRWLDMGSQEVYDRIRSEKANPQADVWFGGPNTIFARGVRDGLLEAYRPSWAGSIPEESRGAGDLYFGVYRTPAAILYNREAVAPADAPREWDDMLDPRFAKKVLIRDPMASGTMRAIWGWILAKSVAETGSPDRGFEWLRRLDAQTKEYVVQSTLLCEKIVRREGLVTMWDLPDILLEAEKTDALAWVFPESGTPVIDDAVALVKGAKHPEAAKQLIEWLGTPEAQRLAAERTFRLPARTDLPPETLPGWARETEAKLRPAKIDWDLVEREGPGWMARWDREIRGRGGKSM
jgi:iron(III) transport system substrate-binding protein